MNRDTFIFAMLFEGILALIAMGLLFSDVGALIYLIASGLFAAVLIPVGLKLKHETDEGKKRKIRLWMALLMLIPIVAAIFAIALVVTALMILYS